MSPLKRLFSVENVKRMMVIFILLTIFMSSLAYIEDMLIYCIVFTVWVLWTAYELVEIRENIRIHNSLKKRKRI